MLKILSQIFLHGAVTHKKGFKNSHPKRPMQEAVKEIIFLVEETEDGYVARALDHSIFTQADSIEELKEMVKDAVECHFDEGDKYF